VKIVLAILGVICLGFIVFFLMAKGTIWIVRSLFNKELPFWQVFWGLVIIRGIFTNYDHRF
jgi:hypothetical protein